jgi:hypothetical protein
MAKFKYLGTPGYVGRFGFLNKGDVVDFKQSEVDYVAKTQSPDWKRVDKPNTSGVGKVLPSPVEGLFDLTRIKWQYGIEKRIKSIKSKSVLIKVCQAMQKVGASIDLTFNELRKSSHTQLVEIIYAEAKRLRWDQPGYEAVSAEKQGLTEEQDSEEEAADTETEEVVEDTDSEIEQTPDELPAEPAEVEQVSAKRVIKRSSKK